MKILVLGGIKSGKSSFSLKLAEKYPQPKIFLATAEPFDTEMAAKIKKHRQERGKNWQTIETPLELATALKTIENPGVVVLDCLTVWLGNLFYHQKNLTCYVEDLLTALKTINFPLIIVSNEVGLGLMPAEHETRVFAENLGLLNQRVARLCDEVFLLVAGNPLKIK
ncbi:bifunctional adenosylcobinamide kinase/adenosylcobinamide-phosphate guanylyltransferase [Thermodesulfatator atlanticus]|uniref:bifunctional adenosylcobinamide kinase/adenosylcobinamide-phosphate guanylyltransferase n=1 Tax=Thermodesulfatator atlanticus TaxID=501497 RepID=UPI0003B71ECC|nr:bifunctional adenosylcobinamide kinase/adenosylcobinamide-phosphate guanylyltransferase [Thermodesulfatator atlanticus]